ncbi:MAG: serine/threonine-protein kinase PknK [Myxococcota bacterium]
MLELPPRFQLKQVLGRGGFGEVQLVFDRDRQEHVALKVLHSKRHHHAFKQEANLHSSLRHPNVIKIYELIRLEHALGIVMEYVPGVRLLDAVWGGQRPGPSSREASRAGWITETLSSSQPLSTGLKNAPSPPRDAEDDRLSVADFGGKTLQPPQLVLLEKLLVQLCEGLLALHASHRVHCDLKPGNLLVTPDNRLVILDLGLVQLIEGQMRLRGGGGTFDYAAPEQLLKRVPTPASDWYAVGVMLYQLLSGRLPFTGRPAMRRHRKLRGEFPSLESIGLHYPPMWSQWINQLLVPSPRVRAGGTQLLEQLGAEQVRREQAPPLQTEPPLIGRHAMLDLLEQWLLGRPLTPERLLLVEGESGIGKSALLRALQQRLQQRVVWVFGGLCRERADVPFKALDDVLEEVMEEVRRLPSHCLQALSLDERAALCQRFPRLEDVFQLREEPEPMPPQRRQQLFFSGVVMVVRQLQTLKPVVWLIDDLQWADEDSAQLLRALHLADSGPPMRMLGFMQPIGASLTPFFQVLLDQTSRVRCRRLRLEPLAPEAAAQLADWLFPELSPEQRQRAVAIAGGSPLFLQKWLQHGLQELSQTSPAPVLTREDLLLQELERLPPPLQTPLELLALLDQPLSWPVLFQALQEPPQLQAWLERLLELRWIKTAGTRLLRVVEFTHFQYRRAVLSRLQSPMKRLLALRLAQALEVLEGAEHEALAELYLEAEAWEQAMTQLLTRAEKALQHGAVALALSLFQRAEPLQTRLAWAPRRRRDMLIRYSQSCQLAGDGLHAAELLEQAYALSPPDEPERDELLRAATLHYAVSGALEKGLTLMQLQFNRYGLKLRRPAWRRIVSIMGSLLLIQLLWPWRKCWKQPPTSSEQHYLDVCASVVQSLGLIDPLTAAEFQGRRMRLLLRRNDPMRLLRALAMEVFCFSAGGVLSLGWVERMRQEAERLMAAQGLSELRGSWMLQLGKAYHHQCRWRACEALCAPAIQLLQQLSLQKVNSLDNIDAFRIVSAKIYGMESAFQRGDFVAHAGWMAGMLDDATQRQQRHVKVHLLTVGLAFQTLVEDRPEDFLPLFEEGQAAWPFQETHLQHFFWTHSLARYLLYMGKAEEAVTTLLPAGRAFWSSMLMFPQHMRIFRTCILGHSLLAALEQHPQHPQRFGWHARVRRCCWVLRLEQQAPAKAQALLLEAGLKCLQARRLPRLKPPLEELLLASEQLFEQAEQEAHRLYVRWARLHQDQAERARIQTQLRALGVVHPRRFARLYLPVDALLGA